MITQHEDFELALYLIAFQQGAPIRGCEGSADTAEKILAMLAFNGDIPRAKAAFQKCKDMRLIGHTTQESAQ